MELNTDPASGLWILIKIRYPSIELDKDPDSSVDFYKDQDQPIELDKC